MPPLYRPLLTLSRVMAVAGGLVLSALILMVCVSIAGRALFTPLHAIPDGSLFAGLATWLLELGIGPITGDVELVEAAMPFVIYAFIPLCQLTAGHAAVDLFTNLLPDRVQRLLRMLAELLFAAVLVMIAIQIYSGMETQMRRGGTTLLLQFPTWWSYAACLPGAIFSAIVAVYVALVRVSELALGRAILVDDWEDAQ